MARADGGADPLARDRRILCATGFARAVATSAVGVLLGIWLPRVVRGAGQVEVIFALGLSGCVALSLAAVGFADRVGRRRFLVAQALVLALGSAGFVLASDWRLLALASFVANLNAIGRDRGAAAVLEQAALASSAEPRRRTRAFAVYTLLQDAGHALGALLAGVPALFAQPGSGRAEALDRGVLLVYPAALLLTAALYRGLSASIECDGRESHGPLGLIRHASSPTRRALARIGALFALDSAAGGILSTALLGWYFFERFGVAPAAIGLLFFAARVLNALSHLVAARLAERIGLVNTMVFTHLPSSVFLLLVPFAPSFWSAAALFLLREALVEMDVPTRQSYVLAIVRPQERTLASGITQLVRLGGWALGPLLAAPLVAAHSLGLALAVGAGMKIAYDLLLWVSFRSVRPPEESGSAG